MYKVDKETIICFGFRTAYGGGKSTGFALVYDSVDSCKKFEPNYRLVRVILQTTFTDESSISTERSRESDVLSSFLMFFILARNGQTKTRI